MEKSIIVAALIIGVSLVISAWIIGEKLCTLKDGVRMSGPLAVVLDKPIEVKAVVSATTPFAVQLTNGQELPVVVKVVDEKKVP